MAASIGHASQVGIGATGSASTYQLDFLTCGLRKNPQHVQGDGIRDSRSRVHETVNEGTYTVDGPLTFEVTPDDIDEIATYWLGGTETTDVWPLAETLPAMTVDVDCVGEIFRYTGVKINRGTLRSSANQPLTMELDLMGLTAASGISFPAIGGTLTDLQPYIHHQLVCTIDGTAYSVDNVVFTIDNALIADRFFNSQTRTELPEGDRIVTLSVDMPFTSTEAGVFLDSAVGGFTGTNTLVWTNGARSLTLTLGILQAAEAYPIINARGQEIGHTVEFQVRRDDSGDVDEVSLTNDNTP